MESFSERVGQRKLFQWAVAYLAGGWLLVQILQFLTETYGWPAIILRVVPVLLLAGFLATLVVAWYHGEKGQQRITLIEGLLLAALLLAGGAGAAYVEKHAASPHAQLPGKALPLVMMMDSPSPDRVYDEETARNNGTNSDVISDILLDLPIRRQKETIGPEWHRDEEIRQFAPDLVLIHFSAFCRATCAEPRVQFRQLLEYFADTDTQFLIYSRGKRPWSQTCAAEHSCEQRLRAAVDSLMADDYATHPNFRSHVHIFGLQDYGSPHWRDPATANALKLRVRKLLNIT